MAFLLSTRDITRNQIAASLEVYLATAPDADKWKDLFQSSTGKLLIDFLAALQEQLLIKGDFDIRNAYLYTSLTRSAAYLLSQMQGYNPNRKRRALGFLTAQITPAAGSPFVIPQDFLIPNVDPLIIPNSHSVGIGDRFITNIEVWQGEWVTVQYSKLLGNLQGVDWEIIIVPEFNFQIDQIEVYIELDGILYTYAGNTINGRTYRLADKVSVLDKDTILVRTDYTGGIFLLFGNGTSSPRVTPNSVVNVRYLRTKGSGMTIVEKGRNLGQFNISGATVKFTVTDPIQGGSDEDSIEKVRVLASRFYQAGGRAITGHDYEAFAMSYPGVISARAIRDEQTVDFDNVVGKYKQQIEAIYTNMPPIERSAALQETLDDMTTEIVEGLPCCTVLLSALRQNEAPYDVIFRQALQDYIDLYKSITARVILVEPTPIDLDTTIRVVARLGIDEVAVRQLILEELAVNTNRLGVTLRPNVLIDKFTDLDQFILRVYFDVINGNTDTSIEIPLEFDQYFHLNNIIVNFELKIGKDDE